MFIDQNNRSWVTRGCHWSNRRYPIACCWKGTKENKGEEEERAFSAAAPSSCSSTSNAAATTTERQQYRMLVGHIQVNICSAGSRVLLKPGNSSPQRSTSLHNHDHNRRSQTGQVGCTGRFSPVITMRYGNLRRCVPIYLHRASDAAHGF